MEELARTIGVDPPVLAGTIASFNEAAKRGEDPAFGKGASTYNRANGDPRHGPNPCLAPLLLAPFYAVRVFPGSMRPATMRRAPWVAIIPQPGLPSVRP